MPSVIKLFLKSKTCLLTPVSFMPANFKPMESANLTISAAFSMREFRSEKAVDRFVSAD